MPENRTRIVSLSKHRCTYIYIYIIIIIKYIVCTKKGRKSERCVCSIKRGRQRVYTAPCYDIAFLGIFQKAASGGNVSRSGIN